MRTKLARLVTLLLPLITASAWGQNVDPQEAMERFQSLSSEEQRQILERAREARGGLAEPGRREPGPQGTKRDPGQTGLDPDAPVVRPSPRPPTPDNVTGEVPTRSAETPAEPADQPLSRLERRMNRVREAGELEVESQPRNIRQTLRQFGYDLFRGTPTTFAPATDIPVPSDYVIGPQDTLNINLFGTTNRRLTLEVNREGRIDFPEVGPLTVAGMEFDQLQSFLEKKVRRHLVGAELSVSLGPLRSIRVFVLGDVRRPGTFTVSALSTITNALFVSGGIQTNGSLRQIQLKRNGARVTELDLYELLLRGDTRADVRLQPGDVIFVPPIGETVGVAGEVKRPGIYEVIDEKTVQGAIELAGGLSSMASPEHVQLDRIATRDGRQMFDLDLGQRAGRRTTIQDGDLIRVYDASRDLADVVLLRGHVKRPGSYQWRPGMRLTDLLPDLDSLRATPDLDYVLITREMPQSKRITVRSTSLDRALDAPSGPADLRLAERDTVRVFNRAKDRQAALAPVLETLRNQAHQGARTQIVTVRGRVRDPGDYPLERQMSVNDLIRAAGGLREDAYTLSAELTRFDVAEDERQTQTRAIALGKTGETIRLQPDDTLNVKVVPRWYEKESVRVEGEIRFPGKFTISRGETLTSVLERAGGLTEEAYPEGAVLSRQSLRAKEAKELARLKRRLRSELAAVSLEQLQGPDGSATGLGQAQSLINQIEDVEPVGRLVVDLPAVLAGRQSVRMRDGDQLVIPPTPEEVTILGEVQQTTSLFYRPDLDRDNYIERAGGLTAKADQQRIYVIRADGSIAASPRSVWFGHGAQEIQRGDTIVIPLDVTRLRPLTFWQTVADISSKLALTIASANAVGVF